MSLIRQDKELEALFAWFSFHNTFAHRRRWIKNLCNAPQFDYLPGVAHALATFGKDAVEYRIENELPHGPLRAQQAFWRFAGLTVPQDVETGIECFRPGICLLLPSEFWEFSQACNQLLPKPYQEFSSPWEKASLLFSQSASPYAVLTDQERHNLVARHEKSNHEIARLLGIERLFPALEKRDDTPEPKRLTLESALHIAATLPRPFACQLLEQFESTPIEYLEYTQWLCCQALSQVCKGTPPARHRLPLQAPQISVLTLTYNHSKYIEDTIRSVIAQQTNVPVQHIIADDASDDGAQEIILEYARQYPHITPILQKKRSSGIRNLVAMFDMARSPYVALCDGDDYFSDPLKLQSQYDFLEQNPSCSLCFHPVRVVFEDNPAQKRFYPTAEQLPRGTNRFYYLSDLMRFNFIQTNSVMYRWRFAAGLADWFCSGLMPGDRYWHLLHAELGKIGFINKAMSNYRRHSAAVYSVAERDKLAHRYKTGMYELETYAEISSHFKGKYDAILLDLTNGILADMVQYMEKIDDFSKLSQISQEYPRFSAHFLNSLDSPQG